MYRVKKIITENIIELLFSIFGTEIIYGSIYREITVLNFVVIAIFNFLLFIFYDIVLEKEEKGPRLYIPVLIVICIIFGTLIKTEQIRNDLSYSTWIFNGGHILQNCTSYEIATLIVITFIFSSMYFYFSVKIYRKPILLLLVFMVIIIHMKCIYDKYSYLGYIFILLFVCIIFKKSVGEDKQVNESINIKKNHVIISGIFFIALLAVSTIIIPKPSLILNIPVLNTLKDYFNIEIKSIEGNGFNVELNKNRKINESTKENSETVIFELTGSNPKYLISHNYDKYENNEWELENNQLYLGQNISKLQKSIPIDFTLSRIDMSSLNDIKKLKQDYSFSNVTYLKPSNFATYEISHPSNTTKCEIKGNSDDLFLNGYDMIMNRKLSYFPVNNEYNIFYNSNEPESGTRQDLIMKYFNIDRYEKFLKEVCDQKTAASKMQEMDSETASYIDANCTISNKVKGIIKKITKNSESNYDKAKDIENYLKNGDFEYDLSIDQNVDNGSDYINYFILDSKKGYCVQFATAMTLMCREIGIPARYCEGYLVSEEEFHKNVYEVKESYAHAFVEVYIPGYGWKIFDPTPSLDDKEDIFGSDQNEIYDKVTIFKIYKNYIVISGIILFAVVACFFSTKRYRKIRKILRNKNDKALEKIIKDCIQNLSKVNIKPYENETEMIFAKRIYDKYKISLIDIVKIYYDNKYNNKNITREQIKIAIKEDKNIYKFTKSYKKQR